MRRNLLEFLRRGVVSCGIGPVVLAVIYLILEASGVSQELTAGRVAVGIFSLSALAFVAGGMNFLYRIERLSLMAAVSIHGGVLYVCYLGTYLINGWLAWGMIPIIVFTAIFAVGYVIIWVAVYGMVKRRTERINFLLKKQ